MCLKFRTNRWWIAFCILVSLPSLAQDIRVVFDSSAQPLEDQERIPESVKKMRSVEPIYTSNGKATFPNGSVVHLMHAVIAPNSWYRNRLGTDGNLSVYAQPLRHDVTGDIPIANRLGPNIRDWIYTSRPSLVESGGKSFISGEYFFHTISNEKPTMSYAAAWLSEAKTVGQYDVSSQSWLSDGIDGEISIKEDGFIGVQVGINLHSDVCQTLYGKGRAYALILIDNKNRVHYSWQDSLSVMDSDPFLSDRTGLEARFSGIHLDAVKSVRFVAAPFHWVYFQNSLSLADKNRQTKGIYPIPTPFRAPLLGNGVVRSASNVGIAHNTVIVEATKFPPASTAHAVRDAVIVASGRPDLADANAKGATFTLYLPRYLANHSVTITAYDAAGNANTHSMSGEHFSNHETEYATCEAYVFDEFQQADVKRVVLSVW